MKYSTPMNSLGQPTSKLRTCSLDSTLTMLLQIIDCLEALEMVSMLDWPQRQSTPHMLLRSCDH
jgi:hypothetical protein